MFCIKLRVGRRRPPAVPPAREQARLQAQAAMAVNAADASEALVRSDSIQLRSKVQPAADPAGSNHRTFLGFCATVLQESKWNESFVETNSRETQQNFETKSTRHFFSTFPLSVPSLPW
jgi:hypothetical protein